MPVIGYTPKTELITVTTTNRVGSDLEAATKTITATSKQGTPDYTETKSALSKPSNSKLVMKRACIGLEVTVDSMTAGHLYGSIEIGTTEVLTSTEFDLTGAGASQQKCKDITEIILVQKDMAIKVYFWVDAGNAVISLVKVHVAYGTKEITFTTGNTFAELKHTGLFNTNWSGTYVGVSGGSRYMTVREGVDSNPNTADGRILTQTGAGSDKQTFHTQIAIGTIAFYLRGDTTANIVNGVNAFDISIFS